jgi:hypothetical protein
MFPVLPIKRVGGGAVVESSVSLATGIFRAGYIEALRGGSILTPDELGIVSATPPFCMRK